MDATFHKTNRAALLKELNSGALVIIAGYGEVQRMNDNAVPFDQEANFWYLTGIEQAGWWLILDGINGTEWLVAPELTEMQQIFEGGINQQVITTTSGIKTILSRDEAMRRIRELVKHHSLVYTAEQPHWLREHPTMQLNTAQGDLKKVLERIFDKVDSCNKELAKLRSIKRPEEIQAIQRAIDLTVAAFKSIHDDLKSGRFEYELDAKMTYEIQRRGARHAYDPIVASGINACTLHYIANSSKLQNKSLVLFDVGARVDGYAADISRTYAVGTPTKRQVAVHAAVEDAQKECIALMKPGLNFQEYQGQCEVIMKQALQRIGLSVDKYRDYFPHAMGHGLGVDVHDPIAGYDSFQPGMVMTVEPGIYIPEESIGVRIEDDILITDTGHRVLSAKLSTDIG